MTLPSEDYLADVAGSTGLIDVFAIRDAREQVKAMLANRFESQWQTLYAAMQPKAAYSATGEQIGQRALAHLALDFLSYRGQFAIDTAQSLLSQADNLTDRLAALRALSRAAPALAEQALSEFYQHWQSEALVVNQWFSLQAAMPAPDAAARVLALQHHEAFDWRNPNKIRALIGAFANANPMGFHAIDGSGYQLLADAIIRLQAANPQIAARLCTPLTRYRRYAHGAQLMRQELARIAAVSDLSRDVFEVVDKSLKG